MVYTQTYWKGWAANQKQDCQEFGWCRGHFRSFGRFVVAEGSSWRLDVVVETQNGGGLGLVGSLAFCAGCQPDADALQPHQAILCEPLARIIHEE